MAESVDWSAFAGDSPPYFEPFDIDYPVAPQSTWATGGTARWPDGSGPGTGKIVVAGSDDVSTYDPDTDILVFGFRDGSGGVTEMGAQGVIYFGRIDKQFGVATIIERGKGQCHRGMPQIAAPSVQQPSNGIRLRQHSRLMAGLAQFLGHSAPFVRTAFP